MSSLDPTFVPSADADGLPPAVVPLDRPESADIPYIQLVRPEPAAVVELGPPELPPATPEPRPPHPGFWWAVLWCLGFFLVTQIIPTVGVMLVLTVFLLVARPDLASGDLTGELTRLGMPVCIVVAQITAILFTLVVARVMVGRDWTRKLALRRPSFQQLFLVLLATPAFMILAGLVGTLARKIGLPTIQYQEQVEGLFAQFPLWASLLLFAAAPGFLEELFCRGFLGRGLVGRYGPVVGVALTSLLFGAMHVDPPHVIATAFMGMGLHFIYLTTRSLWMPMLVHCFNNGLGAVASTYKNDLPQWLKDLDEGSPQMLLMILAGVVLLVAAAAWGLYRCRTRFVADNLGEPAWQPDYAGLEFPVVGLGVRLRPRYSGVEHPPAESRTTVVRPWPGILPVLATLCAAGLFVGSITLNAALTERGPRQPAESKPVTPAKEQPAHSG
jgi:membrane protease YdiL (CAAX protease family)